MTRPSMPTEAPTVVVREREDLVERFADHDRHREEAVPCANLGERFADHDRHREEAGAMILQAFERFAENQPVAIHERKRVP